MFSWRTRWRIFEYVRNSIWLVPALFMTLAIVLGIALPDLDASVDTTLGITYGSGAAQGMLGAIVSGMITFTGFVFSILLLAVQFGSSQFSPRMLRRFLRDPTTKFALGIFMMTFMYSLLVLRTIGADGNENFVPDNSISVALLMLLASMIMFLRLISTTTQGLRVASVTGDLARETAKVIDRIYPDRVEDRDRLEPDPDPREGRSSRVVTYERHPGILQSVDARGLVEIGQETDTVIELIPTTGDLLAPETPLFRIWGESQAVDEARLQNSIATGDERNLRQDPAFGFRLLADISSKALSPGVNDPTTSIQALDQIELLLKMLARRRLTPGSLESAAGQVRLIYPTSTWESFLSLALDETRYFGQTSFQVMRRLRALLEGLRDWAPEHRRPAVEHQLGLLESSVERSYDVPAESTFAGAADRQGIGSPQAPTR
ncbi:MAG TPA: DUF2254 domain-containing protein [Solirubrobacterales bacterium]|nr:DUF2254 domain-containing protein [Solirubrobacterales bacterium]